VRPSWKRIVERNPGDKGGRDEFVRRGPKAETVSGKKQRLKIRKTYMMGMKVERTGIGGQGEVFGSVYVFRGTWVIFFVRVIRKLTICFGPNRNFLISCARSLPSTSSLVNGRDSTVSFSHPSQSWYIPPQPQCLVKRLTFQSLEKGARCRISLIIVFE
jgi:hypothetical protein